MTNDEARMTIEARSPKARDPNPYRDYDGRQGWRDGVRDCAAFMVPFRRGGAYYAGWLWAQGRDAKAVEKALSYR
jgi:hypothetical protein